MQTLVFNTTTKTIKLYDGIFTETSNIVETMDSIPTVKALDGFYEVMRRDEFEKTYPVMRLPISNTNVIFVR